MNYQRTRYQTEVTEQVKSTQNLPTINGIPIQPINMVIPKSQLGAIYIGDVDAAKDIALLKKNGIKAVLTIAREVQLRYNRRDVQMHQIINADDQDHYDLSQHFSQTYDFIQQARKATNILVHCQAGVSRSTTIVIAYLMRKNRWRTDQAYQTVKSKRRLTCPNLGFCRQLKQFQKQLGLVDDRQGPSSPKNSKTQNIPPGYSGGPGNFYNPTQPPVGQFTPQMVPQQNQQSQQVQGQNNQMFYPPPYFPMFMPPFMGQQNDTTNNSGGKQQPQNQMQYPPPFPYYIPPPPQSQQYNQKSPTAPYQQSSQYQQQPPPFIPPTPKQYTKQTKQYIKPTKQYNQSPPQTSTHFSQYPPQQFQQSPPQQTFYKNNQYNQQNQQYNPYIQQQNPYLKKQKQIQVNNNRRVLGQRQLRIDDQVYQQQRRNQKSSYQQNQNIQYKQYDYYSRQQPRKQQKRGDNYNRNRVTSSYQYQKQKLNSPMKNYKPFAYGNYSRPYNTNTLRSYQNLNNSKCVQMASSRANYPVHNYSKTSWKQNDTLQLGKSKLRQPNFRRHDSRQKFQQVRTRNWSIQQY